MLPEGQRRVLVLRFGLDSGTPRTLEEVGVAMGFSPERARQGEEASQPYLRQARRANRSEAVARAREFRNQNIPPIKGDSDGEVSAAARTAGMASSG